MTVRPTPSGQTPRSPIGRTDRTAPSAPSQRQAEPNPAAAAGVRGDRVQISSQARELQQLDLAARGPGGELPAERLRQVLGRMNDGHYDRPDVQEQVIRRLARDL